MFCLYNNNLSKINLNHSLLVRPGRKQPRAPDVPRATPTFGRRWCLSNLRNLWHQEGTSQGVARLAFLIVPPPADLSCPCEEKFACCSLRFDITYNTKTRPTFLIQCKSSPIRICSHVSHRPIATSIICELVNYYSGFLPQTTFILK